MSKAAKFWFLALCAVLTAHGVRHHDMWSAGLLGVQVGVAYQLLVDWLEESVQDRERRRRW